MLRLVLGQAFLASHLSTGGPGNPSIKLPASTARLTCVDFSTSCALDPHHRCSDSSNPPLVVDLLMPRRNLIEKPRRTRYGNGCPHVSELVANCSAKNRRSVEP